MDLTKLTRLLLSDEELAQSETGFLEAYQSFLDFFERLSGIAVYFGKTDSYAYVANTAFLLQRLIQDAEFKGEVCLVYDKGDEVLCNKICRNLPFFEGERYSYAADAAEITQPFVLSGGGNQDEDFWSGLGEKVRYVMTIRPYLDGEDFSFIKLRDGQSNWITYYTDTISLNESFSARNYYVPLDSVRTISEEKKTYWHGLYKNLDMAERILSNNNAALFTVDGIGAKSSAINRGESVILMLALALLTELKRNPKSYILAVTDIFSAEDKSFSLLQSFCSTKADAEGFWKELVSLYPAAKEEDLRVGLFEPLLKEREQLKSVLEQVTFADKPGDFRENRLYICGVGELPYDYLAALFARSSYLFFESCDYTNLAVNLGIPYLQKSMEVCSANYPDCKNPTVAAYLESLCEPFKNDISSYTGAMDKNLSLEIDALAAFLKDPKQEYFTEISNIAQGRKNGQETPSLTNDKLAASGGVFYMMYGELSHTSMRGGRYQNKKCLGASLNELYQTLRDAFNEEKKTLNLSAVLTGTRAADYLKGLADGESFSLSLESIDDIVLESLEDDTAGSVLVRGISAVLEDVSFTIRFLSWYGGDCLMMQLHGSSSIKQSLFDIPWLRLEDISFDVMVTENDCPISGSISGYFGRTQDYNGANFCMNLNRQTGVTQIMASLRQPLTALDAFGAVAGGIDFHALLPKELLSVVSLGLSELVFLYDMENNRIASMSFSFENAASQPWILWEKDGKALLTARPEISVTILSPADLANRQILLSIGCFVDIGEPENGDDIGQLWLNASYPPFTAQLRMASETISLTKLLELFDCHMDLDINITDLSILADFDNHIYQLSAAVEGGWTLTDGFAVTGLRLGIADKAGKFSIAFAGSMKILDNISVAVGIGYDDGSWMLSAQAALNKDVVMSDLVNAYKGDCDIVVSDEKDNPLIADISFSLIKDSEKTDYEITAGVEQWSISLFEEETAVSASGTIGRKNNSFYGYLQASVTLLGADMIVRLNYDTAASFELIWGAFSGIVDWTQEETVARIAVSDFSIGEMIETFIGWLKGSAFSLDEPWNALEKVVLDFELVYSFTAKKFTLKIKENIDLGIGCINSLDVVYDPSAQQKIAVQLSVTYAWKSEAEQLGWDAAEPGTAPVPVGTGNNKFDLRYLAFGQRLRFFEEGYHPQSTQEAITYLKEHTSPEQFPQYDDSVGVLAAAELGILKENASYFIDASMVLYDPALYALCVKLDGAAAKVFAGFSFEIIYARLSETLGVFQSTIVLPEKFRKLELGIFTVTLPDFYIEVYTNGDFKVDIGFPKNGDFSRSFSLSGVVPPGIPLTGAAGLYFGRMSSATAGEAKLHLPETNKGIFHPAIAFGLGLRLGIGKDIAYGVLSGGFSITASVILEGVLAKWLPYNSSDTQEPWYHYLEGIVSVTGNIYGCIDFSIISACVNLTLNFTAAFIYETCRNVLLTVSAYVEAAASLRINLGLFKITIGFHFKVEVKESFVLGENSVAPWDENALELKNKAVFLFPGAAAADIDFGRLTAVQPIAIKGNMSLSLTAAADEYTGRKKHVLANILLTIQEGKDFNALARTLIYWVTASAYGKSVTQDELQEFAVSDNYLAGLEAYFENETVPVKKADAEAFLERFFALTIADNAETAAALSEGETVAGVYFPLLPEMELAVFYGGEEETRYVLAEYNTLSNDAAAVFKEMFRKLAVAVEKEEKRKHGVDGGMSVSELLLCDWFGMAAKHIVRSMRLQLRNKGVDALKLKELVQSFEEQGFYKELSGILSRYFLHGLRLPTISGDEADAHKLIIPNKKGLWVMQQEKGLILPREAGIFALTGQSFQVYGGEDDKELLKVVPKSGNTFLKLPDGFTLEISNQDGSAAAAEAVAQYADTFKISYAMPEIKAEWIPAVFSFGNPITMSGASVWTIPDSLYQYFNGDYDAYPRFGLYLLKQEESGRREVEGLPLSLIEFSVTKTAQKGVYIIGNASAKDIDVLEMLISAAPEIKQIQLITAQQESFLAISQMNLSTETRPPEMVRNMQPLDTLKLLWKALVTNNSGYVLTYRDAAGTVLGDKVTLAVSYGFSLACGDSRLALVNAVLLQEEPQSGESLAAFAQRYDYCMQLKDDKEDLIPQSIAQCYCTDIRAIAERNGAVILNERTQWDFTNVVKQTGDTAELISFSAYPQKGESLAAFAQRNGLTAACALWMNREKAGLFAANQQIIIPVGAGFRAGAGSENTCSAINERFLITRELPTEPAAAPNDPVYAQSVLENNYSLLCYGMKGKNEFSSPVSYKETDKDLQYDISIPVDEYMGGGYCSCGKLVQNDFVWLDYYGNRLCSPFFAARLAGYQDALLGLEKWQSVSTQWVPKQSENSVICVCMSFSTDGYDSAEQRICAQKIYSRLQKQVQDEKLKIYLQCSMFTEKSAVLDKQPLYDMLNKIMDFFNTGEAEETEFCFDFSFDGSPFTESDLFPLECRFVMEREGVSACGYEEVSNLLHTETVIGLPKDLRSFDKDFRNSFEGYIALKSGGASSVYAYKASDLHIETDMENKLLFLPKPFSNELISCDKLLVRPYADGMLGEQTERSIRFVDLNVWMRNAFKCLDSIFTADIVSAARLAECDYDSLLEAKAMLSEKLSGMLLPAFKSMADKQVPQEAVEAFRQRLLAALSAYFEVKAIVVFEANVSGLPKNATLYGELVDNGEKLLSYSTLKLQNGVKEKAAFSITGQDVVLDKNGAVVAETEAQLQFPASHIESNITPVIDGFHTSDWQGKITQNIAEVDFCEKTALKIPLPLSTFPELPKMVSQEAVAAEEPYQWRYAFTYSRTYHYPQQIVRCSVKYNVSLASMKNEEQGFLPALAQLDTAGEAVLADLQALAAEINAAAGILPEEALAEHFRGTFACAVEMFSELAQASFDTLRLSASRHAASEQIDFTITEKRYGEGFFSMIFDDDGIEPQIKGYTAEMATERTWIFKNEEGYLSYARGQAIQERRILMPQKEILKYQNAAAEIYVEQNSSLCGEAMQDAFVFTTGIASFEAAIHAACTVEEVNLAQDGDKGVPLSNRFVQYLTKLCGDETVQLQIRGSYSNQMYEGLMPIEQPIFLQTKCPLFKDNIEETAKMWVEKLIAWRKAFTSSAFTEREQLFFELVFFTSMTEVPLLTVKKLFISGELISI